MTTPNQLQFEISATALQSLKAIGTIPGVKILDAAGLCGPGVGRLTLDSGYHLAWAAPREAAGTSVHVASDGTYLLYSASGNKWIQVQVYAAYLAPGTSADVALVDLFGTPQVLRDATAAEALAGDEQTWTVSLHNTSGSTIGGLLVWLDPLAHASLDISLDGVTWSRPIDAGTALAIASITAGSSATLHVRRTLAAGSASAANALLGLHVTWATPTAAAAVLRGRFRIFNAACFRIYRSQERPPRLGDTPWTTAATLPHSPAGTFADGTWYIAVTYFNGVFESGFYPIGPRGESFRTLTVSGGVASAALPIGPSDWNLQELVAGIVTVAAVDAVDPADPLIVNAGLEWAVFYKIDSGSWIEIDLPYTSGGLAVLSCSLPAQTAGTVVSVRVRVRRNDGTGGSPVWVYSADVAAASITIGSGPSAPLAVGDVAQSVSS